LAGERRRSCCFQASQQPRSTLYSFPAVTQAPAGLPPLSAEQACQAPAGMQEAMRRGAFPDAALEQAPADGGAAKHDHAQPLAARLGSHAGSADGAALRGRAWSRRSRE